MKIKATFDFSSLQKELFRLEEALQDKVLKNAAEAGGNVYRDAYIAAVPQYLPTGTFKDRNGQIQHFQQLFSAISSKTQMFADKTGAYCIVGVTSAPGTRKPLAPQATWIDEGTDDRKHKDGSKTGRVTAAHILQKVVEANTGAAQDAAVESLRKGIASVLGN